MRNEPGVCEQSATTVFPRSEPCSAWHPEIAKCCAAGHANASITSGYLHFALDVEIAVGTLFDYLEIALRIPDC
jgi:hypothetical protein